MGLEAKEEDKKGEEQQQEDEEEDPGDEEEGPPKTVEDGREPPGFAPREEGHLERRAQGREEPEDRRVDDPALPVHRRLLRGRTQIVPRATCSRIQGTTSSRISSRVVVASNPRTRFAFSTEGTRRWTS